MIFFFNFIKEREQWLGDSYVGPTIPLIIGEGFNSNGSYMNDRVYSPCEQIHHAGRMFPVEGRGCQGADIVTSDNMSMRGARCEVPFSEIEHVLVLVMDVCMCIVYVCV